uniref:hypothetical protein n=1 Tax=Salmonella sp. s51228 TaxID=3159652 RepID=UPI00397EFE18
PEFRTDREDEARMESVVSPLLWLLAILSILLFSPCGYLAFAFTCFAFWSETGGNNNAARWLSSMARICAFIAFMMVILLLVTTRYTPTETGERYCLFEGKSYELCF